MKTGIVYYSQSKNIGDDIQTYAASKLVSDPEYIEREKLNEVTQNIPSVISGWFMHHPANFPPSNTINPLFVSFHGKESVINSKNRDYFKKYEPIGCRDYSTLKLFEKIDVKAYYSGCATLTLQAPQVVEKRSDEIIVVDLLRANYTENYRNLVAKEIVPKEWRDKVSYFSHFIDDLPEKSFDERMKMVEQLLTRYAKAKLVVTSLIHCALPCLAMGTPVLFVDFGFNKSEVKRDRFEGITDLMNICPDIQAPFAKRNYLHTGLRVLRFHHLFKNKIQQIPSSYFEEAVANPPFKNEIPNAIKETIKQFENQF